MKYCLKSSTSLLALTAALGVNTATAADLPLKGAYPSEVMSWTGPYVGLTVGGAWDNLAAPNGTAVFTGAPTNDATGDLSGNNFVVGADAGFNYQFGSWVAGVEGDLSGFPFEKTRHNLDGSMGFIEGNLSGLASLRGRIGMVFDRTLVYATGGWGWIGNNFSLIEKPGQVVFVSTTQSAPVVGGGFDYKVTRNLTVGVEGLAFLNDRSTAIVSSTGRTYNVGSGTIGVVRARVSYNW